MFVQVMLLGHSDDYTADKIMKVTIVFNRFASGLIERMPRLDECTYNSLETKLL
jgi:pectate lyase